jgi:NAD(P)-dependent dehydrogenase (short-subunit alcohol dehydrogenase family)
MSSARPAEERDPATIPTSPESHGSVAGRGRLAGRRILVVGAGSQPCDDTDAPIGNGRAIAVLCAREGASVACADRDREAAEHTLRLIAGEGGQGAVLVGDVTEEQVCAEIVREAQAALQGLDGVSSTSASVMDGDWRIPMPRCGTSRSRSTCVRTS